MKKVIILLAIIILCWGCKKDTAEIKGVTVNLIIDDNPNIFKKSVILFDDSAYLIKTPLDTFLLGYPFTCISCCIYNDMKIKAINDATAKDILMVSDYMKYKSDSTRALAYYLETGKCYMLDKQLKKSIKTIQVIKYSEGKPMESWGGRRFYINNNLFLQIVDWMSK